MYSYLGDPKDTAQTISFMGPRFEETNTQMFIDRRIIYRRIAR